jgi:hypothetical protein
VTFQLESSPAFGFKYSTAQVLSLRAVVEDPNILATLNSYEEITPEMQEALVKMADKSTPGCDEPTFGFNPKIEEDAQHFRDTMAGLSWLPESPVAEMVL